MGVGICEQQSSTWIVSQKVSSRKNMRGVFFTGKFQHTPVPILDTPVPILGGLF